jgi:hypothetical protein
VKASRSEAAANTTSLSSRDVRSQPALDAMATASTSAASDALDMRLWCEVLVI